METNETTDGKVFSVEVSTNGRRITLDPIRTKKLDIEIREVESIAPCGFRLEWLEGTDEEGNGMVMQPALLGWLTFQYRGKEYVINARDLCQAVMEFANEEGD